jgi:excisionase family DNA binding protein
MFAQENLTRKRNNLITKAAQKVTTKSESKPVITYQELKDKELLTIKETCILLNITHVTLRRWIKSKRVISSRLGKKHLINRIHINDLILQSVDT